MFLVSGHIVHNKEGVWREISLLPCTKPEFDFTECGQIGEVCPFPITSKPAYLLALLSPSDMIVEEGGISFLSLEQAQLPFFCGRPFLYFQRTAPGDGHKTNPWSGGELRIREQRIQVL